MPTPALSVILPNYNHASFLPKSLEAILDQSFRDFELIVIDDCSTDRSVRLLEEYARRDRRIRFYRNERNRGVIYTLNRALSLARAPWVFGAASDDYVLPGYFLAAMDLLGRYPQAGLCCGRTVLVGEKGEYYCEAPDGWSDQPAYLSADTWAEQVGPCGVPGTAIWNREAFRAAGGYDASLRWHADWFPLQVVAMRHGVCYLPRRVAVCRYTPNSYSAGQGESGVQRQVICQVLRQFRQECYADTLERFGRSNVLGQLCPELLRTVACRREFQDEHMLRLVGRLFLQHGDALLQDSWAAVRRGTAVCLQALGQQAWPLIPALARAARDRNRAVARAARTAHRSILAGAPLRRSAKYVLRRSLGAGMRAAKSVLRPVVAYCYRRLNYKLYHRLDYLEQETSRLTQALYQVHLRVEALNARMQRTDDPTAHLAWGYPLYDPIAEPRRCA